MTCFLISQVASVLTLHLYRVASTLCLQCRKQEMTAGQEPATAFWVRSWLGEDPDCQVTSNDVRAPHNQKTPANQEQKTEQQKTTTELASEAALSAPYPFLVTGGTAGKACILKGCPFSRLSLHISRAASSRLLHSHYSLVQSK